MCLCGKQAEDTPYDVQLYFVKVRGEKMGASPRNSFSSSSCRFFFSSSFIRLFASFSCCARLRDSSGVRVPAPVSISPALALLYPCPDSSFGYAKLLGCRLISYLFCKLHRFFFVYSSLYCFPVPILNTTFLLFIIFRFCWLCQVFLLYYIT